VGPTHVSLPRAAAVAVGVGLLVAGLVGRGLFASSASAATLRAGDPAAVATASTLARLLDARSAGSYIDRATGELVVTVTDAAGARTARSAGAVAKPVARSGAQLRSVTSALAAAPQIPGTGWAVNPETNQVEVWADSTVSADRFAALTAVTSSFGAAVRVERVTGAFTTRVMGGSAIYGGVNRCTLGFNVRRGAQYGFLTAGHCGNAAPTWYAAPTLRRSLLGSVGGSSFPDNDYAIVYYSDDSSAAHPGAAGTQDITSAATPVVHQDVTALGATSGSGSGRVLALNAVVNYQNGTRVSGLIVTDICVLPGDSGGPLFSGTVAFGLNSGGSDDCAAQSRSFFQPVVEALTAYGVSVY